jgi:hypothetical protein
MLRIGGALGPSYTGAETAAKAHRRGDVPALWGIAPHSGGTNSMIMVRGT